MAPGMGISTPPRETGRRLPLSDVSHYTPRPRETQEAHFRAARLPLRSRMSPGGAQPPPRLLSGRRSPASPFRLPLCPRAPASLDRSDLFLQLRKIRSVVSINSNTVCIQPDQCSGSAPEAPGMFHVKQSVQKDWRGSRSENAPRSRRLESRYPRLSRALSFLPRNPDASSGPEYPNCIISNLITFCIIHAKTLRSSPDGMRSGVFHVKHLSLYGGRPQLSCPGRTILSFEFFLPDAGWYVSRETSRLQVCCRICRRSGSQAFFCPAPSWGITPQRQQPVSCMIR